MAKVGLSKSYYAIYNAESGSVRYTNGGVLGKAVDADISLDNADPVVFYADNGPAESAAQFSGGTLTITNDRLALAPVAAVLGLEVTNVTTPAGGKGIDFPADLNVPYVGYGTINKSIVDGAAEYAAIILTKVQFQSPGLSATTQGETIAFEGHPFTARILRDDQPSPKWLKYYTFSTEADAENYIKNFLGITGE